MRIKSDVKIEGDSWEIVHTYDETEVLKACQEERNSGREGDIEKGKAKLIARIPRHRLYSDLELQLYSKHKGIDDVEADKWFNTWLAKHPEFRTTTGGRKGIL